MKWFELKQVVKQSLESRDLKEPRIRLGALDGIEELLRLHHPEILADPHCILGYERKDFKNMLGKHKDTGTLNKAQSSVVNDIYRFLKAGSPRR